MKSQLIFIIFTFLCLVHSQNETCKVLLLQSGGDKGAYQAGVLQAFAQNLPAADIQYDIISGVSVGGLNAFLLSFFPVGQESQAADFLVQTWESIASADIYEQWPGGVSEGLLDETGVFNTAPFAQYLASFNNQSSVRPIYLGLANADNGTFIGFSNQGLDRADLISLVMGTNAFPFYYPYVLYQTIPYVDGSVMNTIDYYEPIQYCLNQGFTEDQIVMDVIFTDTTISVTQEDFTGGTAFGMGLRGLQLLLWEEGYDDMFHLFLDYSAINFRYMVMPSETLKEASNYPYSFTTAELQGYITTGLQDGVNAINAGPKGSFAAAKSLSEQHHQTRYRNGRERKTNTIYE
jgi:predicted acylesterase/phospholipase RssA